MLGLPHLSEKANNGKVWGEDSLGSDHSFWCNILNMIRVVRFFLTQIERLIDASVFT